LSANILSTVKEYADHLFHGQGRKLRDDWAGGEARIDRARREHGDIIVIVGDLEAARENLGFVKGNY
jgi:hypothetical protein